MARRNACFLRDSEKLRVILESRLKKSGLSIAQIAREIKIDSTKLYGYYHRKPYTLTQSQLLKLCNFFGVSVDLKISTIDDVSV